MKKLISFLTAAAMLTSLTANTVFAEEEEVNPLREIAASFGAKTDYFLFPNYSTLVSASDKDSRYVEFFKRCNNTEAFNSPAASYAGTLGGGRCLGISILEILSHNGVISPSDIYEGAQYLTDIPKDLDNGRLDNIISHYQALQLYTELELYMRWFMCKYSN